MTDTTDKQMRIGEKVLDDALSLIDKINNKANAAPYDVHKKIDGEYLSEDAKAGYVLAMYYVAKDILSFTKKMEKRFQPKENT